MLRRPFLAELFGFTRFADIRRSSMSRKPHKQGSSSFKYRQNKPFCRERSSGSLFEAFRFLEILVGSLEVSVVAPRITTPGEPS